MEGTIERYSKRRSFRISYWTLFKWPRIPFGFIIYLFVLDFIDCLSTAQGVVAFVVLSSVFWCFILFSFCSFDTLSIHLMCLGCTTFGLVLFIVFICLQKNVPSELLMSSHIEGTKNQIEHNFHAMSNRWNLSSVIDNPMWTCEQYLRGPFAIA